MSILAVAKRDFLNVRRAKLVWAPVALYTVFMVLFYWGQSQSPNPDFHVIIWSLLGIGGVLVVPLIALVAAYLSIAGERESGTIKYTLGAPIDRSAVVLGKLLSRSAVVIVGLLVSLAIGVPISLVLVPEMTVEYGDYLVFVAITMLYAFSYVAVAVGISATTGSRSRAMAGAIGFFFLFNIVWNAFPVRPEQMVSFLIEQLGRDPSNYQNLIDFIFAISPTGAYLASSQLFMTNDFLVEVDNVPDPNAPFYLQGWFMIVILVAWVVVPLAIGTWRFKRADLG